MKSLLKLLMTICLLGVFAYGQTLNPADSQSIQNFGTDSINLQNLSVGISAPIISKPGAIPFSYRLEGNSQCVARPVYGLMCGINFTNINTGVGQFFNHNPVGGWKAGSLSSGAGTFCTADNQSTTDWYFLYVVSPDGSTYYLPSADHVTSESGGGTSCVASVTDYTQMGGLKATINPYWAFPLVGSITFPNGTVYSGLAITDTFGNAITVNSNLTVYTDTLATTALTVTPAAGSVGEKDTYTDTTGTARQVKQILSPFTLHTNFGCGNDGTSSGQYLTTQISYPDGNNLNFTYEPVTGGVTGRIAQITLRTGGTVNYTYGLTNCGSYIPNTVYRATVDGTTQYTFATFAGLNSKYGTTTTVFDPGKNKTVYTFMGTDSLGMPVFGVPLTMTQIQVYQNTGSVVSPSYKLTSTTKFCYNGNATVSTCYGTQAAYPITQKDTYKYTDSTSLSMSHSTVTFDTHGLETSSVNHDYITGQTLTTFTSYGSYTGSGCSPMGDTISMPCDIYVSDGTHTLSETQYSYTGYTTAPTSIKSWTGTAWLQTNFIVNPNNGAVANTTSPNGQVQSFAYNGTGGCNGVLPTSESAMVSGVTLQTSQTWNCNAGVVMTITDMNGNTTPATQYDSLIRPTVQTDNLGFQVTTSYFATSTVVTPS